LFNGPEIGDSFNWTSQFSIYGLFLIGDLRGFPLRREEEGIGWQGEMG